MDDLSKITAWLDTQYLNNRILDYLLACLSFLIIWLILILLKRVVIERIHVLTRKTSISFDDFLVEVVRGVKSYIIPIIAFYFGLKRLTLSESIENFVQHVVVFAVTYQIILIAIQIGHYFINNSSMGRHPNDMSIHSTRRNLRALSTATIWVVGVLFFLSNLGVNISTFVTGLGIGGIAIALAVQSVLGDAFSSFSISIDKPFEIGDFIVIDDLMGTVEHIGLKTTRVRSLGGEMLVFSNSDLTKSRIRNYKKMDNRRINFQIGVVYETTLENVKAIPDILKMIIDNEPDCRFDRAHFMQYADFSLVYDIVYYVESREYIDYADHQQSINFKIFEEFQNRGIEMAFPTQTVHVGSIPSKALDAAT